MPTTTRTYTTIATISKGVVESILFPTSDTGLGEVVIKVAYSIIIAPDVYLVDYGMLVPPEDYPVLLGLGISGLVDAVGEG